MRPTPGTPDVRIQARAVLAGAEAQWQREVEDDVLCEAADLLEAEHGRLTLIERLRASRTVVLGLSSGPLVGEVVMAGTSVVVIEAALESHVIAADAIRWVRGTAPALCPESRSVTPTLAACLREIGCDPVEIVAAGLHLRAARILLVAADHLDAAPLDPIGGADLGQRVSIAYAAIERITRRRRTDAPGRTPVSGRTSG